MLKQQPIIIFILIIAVFTGCTKVQLPESPELKKAIELAGENGSELQKVIKHYAIHPEDSLKLKAAVFLIENMDAHYSHQSQQWEQCQKELSILYSKVNDEALLKAGFDSITRKYTFNDIRFVSDLNVIKASFLIKNIDYAFSKWQTPYASYLTFDEFCEYLLPYRAGKEVLTDDWQEMYNRLYIPEVLSLTGKPVDSISSEDICKALRIHKNGYLHQMPAYAPDYSVQLLMTTKLGPCEQYCLKTILAARCIGVPVVIDFTPQWATRSMGHDWNSLINKDRKALSFGIKDECELGKHIELIPDRIAPKVYRRTFAKQKNSLAMIKGDEEIPPTLSSPCIKDVTEEYYSTADVTVSFIDNAPGKNKFAYLTVFDNQKWIPVSWAEINNKKAIFRNLHTGIVCLPCYYYDKKIVPAAHPMMIDSVGKVIHLIPDTSKTQTVSLTRKYQDNLLKDNGKWLLGGRFQAANNPQFDQPENLHTITETPQGHYQLINVNINKAYKYFRFAAPHYGPGNIAEVEVYEKGTNKKLTGKIFGGFLTATDVEQQQLLAVPFYIRKNKTKSNTMLPPLYSKAQIKDAVYGSYIKSITKRYKLADPENIEIKAKPDSCFENVFDNNPLSSFCRWYSEYLWAGIEFDQPKQIGKIAYLSRNDDNCIRHGERYELFYWDNEWVSLGQQTGSNETYRLTYHNVPTNALFLLRNLTKGKEERIFTYENGKQVWW